MFEEEYNLKQEALKNYKCLGDYQSSFFDPFKSFSDAKKNVKALAALPIINLSFALHFTLDALISTTFGIANIAIGALTFDLKELKCGGSNIKSGAEDLMGALYFAVSMITNTLGTFLRLVAHSLATMASLAGNTVKAISDCFNPAETLSYVSCVLPDSSDSSDSSDPSYPSYSSYSSYSSSFSS